MTKSLITQYVNIKIKKIYNSTKLGFLFLDLNIFIIHFFLINNIGFFLFLILARYAFILECSLFLTIFCRFFIFFILLSTTVLYFAFKNKKFKRLMVLRYSYQKLTYLIGNNYMKAALQKGWVALGVMGASEVATQGMSSLNKIQEIKAVAEEGRKTAELLPEKEKIPFLKKNQSTLDYMAKRPSHGLFTSVIHSEAATTMTGQASTFFGKIFGNGK